MTELEKIEQEIASLSPPDLKKLATWIEEYKENPRHPSLNFKRINRYMSVRA